MEKEIITNSVLFAGALVYLIQGFNVFTSTANANQSLSSSTQDRILESWGKIFFWPLKYLKISWAIMIIGVILIILSLGADQIGIGTYPGINWAQLMGAGFGLMIFIFGLLFERIKAKEKKENLRSSSNNKPE